jgi:type III restriction enzyme
MTETIENPVLNGPYDTPIRHFEIGRQGPTGAIVQGRRPSESYVPVPVSRKGRKAVQQELDFDTTGERREVNTLINDVRRQLELWRARNYTGATSISRKLMQYWADPARDNRVLFCQREAAETAIYLAEAAGRNGEPDFRVRLAKPNAIHNDGLPRVALKMATGAGKTVVMAMLIAWQTINKVFSPQDSRFVKRFLIVTPGITIRDRLRVLLPEDTSNYYRERDLVPADLWAALQEAQLVITNYHAFLLSNAREIEGVAANTRKILIAGKAEDPFRETPDAMVSRVLRDLSGRGRGEIVVINDEAHHCYQNRPVVNAEDEDEESRKRNEDARIWYRGLQAVRRKVGIKTVYDLSATPFYLKGSGYNEGYIFPWTVSDFSLMDAIESGIVKVPRIPVDDDASGLQVTYLHLWEHVGRELPKRPRAAVAETGSWVPPEALEGALRSLYKSYAAAFRRYHDELEAAGEPPPVFIVVCPNTAVSKLVYDWIAGMAVEQEDGTSRLRKGMLELLSNVDEDGEWLARPRTILIDSAQLESGDVLQPEFKKAAAAEIATFKAEFRLRYPGADVEKLSDEDLLREVMNTVGKKDRLGEHVRCVVSVSMLTEGWDANTVTHILGIRRFGSQLLCEQVVGRGLRRRVYAVNEEGFFEPEYAEVYGVPFAFIPTSREVRLKPPASPAVNVHAIDSRWALRIAFPKLDGYRVEVPDADFRWSFSEDSRMEVDHDIVATWTQTQGVVGETDEQYLEDVRGARLQRVAYEIARTLVETRYTALEATRRPWLFPGLLDVTRRWLQECVTLVGDTTIGYLLLVEARNRAAEKLFTSVLRQEAARPEILRPVLRLFDTEGSTDDVDFFTRKAVIAALKSHVSHVVLDGKKGNTWEERIAGLLEESDDVASYVKNDHLGLTIPYVHEGRTHQYVPDFLVRLQDRGDGPVRTLIVEVSGGLKAPGPTEAKADAALYQWCPAVNNHGGWGLWDYVEIRSKNDAPRLLREAIERMYGQVGVVVANGRGER